MQLAPGHWHVSHGRSEMKFEMLGEAVGTPCMKYVSQHGRNLPQRMKVELMVKLMF